MRLVGTCVPGADDQRTMTPCVLTFEETVSFKGIYAGGKMAAAQELSSPGGT